MIYVRRQMKPTVWYISKYFAPPTENSPGGRGFLLLKEMAAQDIHVTAIISDSNNLIDVPALKASVMRETIDNVEIVWLKTIRYSVAKSSRRILSWLHFELRLLLLDKSSLPAPDVIIVSSLSLLTVLNGLMLRSKFKCKLVFEVRDIWPLTLVEEGGFNQKNFFVRLLAWVERLGYRKADEIVGTMPNLGEHVRNVLGIAKPVYCIPMGITEEAASAAHAPLPEGYAARYIPSGKFIVAYSGTVGITNALDIFFECAQRLVHESSVHFIVLGDGALLGHFVRTYGHLPNLTFAPRVEKAQVQSVLERCDLLFFSVYPSKVWNYGQSLNKVIDYMLSGKPVLASYSGYPSMINEAPCGHFIEAGNLEQLATEVKRISELPEQARVALGQQGRKWLLENRNYQKLASDYLSILFPVEAKVSR